MRWLAERFSDLARTSHVPLFTSDNGPSNESRPPSQLRLDQALKPGLTVDVSPQANKVKFQEENSCTPSQKMVQSVAVTTPLPSLGLYDPPIRLQGFVGWSCSGTE